MLQRTLKIDNLLKNKSFFLFGPRATGKSTLIQVQLSDKALIFNLLRTDLYTRLAENPSEIESMIAAHPDATIIVIDEVQRIPLLLNEVHRLIEEKKLTFLLTGSSARTLKTHHVNLLAGRAWEANLFPLTSQEIPNFDLMRYVRYGGLPSVYLSEQPEEELFAYVNTYLREEIQAESLVRKIPAFSRFLQTAAMTSGQILNFTSLSSDTGIPTSTVREYYQILEDTFVGFFVPAWQKSLKRKPVSTAKFYYFDIGVKNTLAEIKTIDTKSDLFGQSFEHFIAMELRAYLSYRRIRKTLSYWRTTHGFEVDFIIGDEIAIEVKTTKRITAKHLKMLKRLAEENICTEYYIISQDPIPRKEDNIWILPWQDFLSRLWNDKLISSN